MFRRALPLLSKAAAAAARTPSLRRGVVLGVKAAGLATLIGTTALATQAGPSPGILVYKLDDMNNSILTYSRKDAYDAAAEAKEQFPETSTILWRFARAAYKYADDKSCPKNKKKEIMHEALVAVKKAVELDNESSDAHRWYGTVLEGYGQYESTKEYIANSFEIKTQWKMAVTLNPADATAYHLLGRWSYSVTSMSWMKRKIASALFAAPPTSTYQEAYDYFLRAERISPGFWKKNLVMLGNTCLKLKRDDEAIEWFKKAIKVRVVSEEDKDCHEEARSALRSKGVAI